MKTLLLLLLCGSACAQDYDFQVYNEGIGAQGALSGTFEYLSGMITLSLDGETYSAPFQGVQSLALAAPDGNYLTTRFVGSLGDPTVLLGDITWHLPQGGDWTYCGGSPDCNSAIVMTARTQSFAAQAPEIDSKGWVAGLTLLMGAYSYFGVSVRYKLKKDEHHASIAAELQSAGFCVVDTSRCGAGFPDLCISRNGLWCLVEIKTAVGKKSALQRLRRSQIEFNAKAKGPVIVAYTATEVIHDFNLLLKRKEAYAV